MKRITPTEAQLTEARSILEEANRIYHENHDEYFENPECEAHKQVQALLRKFVLCFNPDHVFSDHDLHFPCITFSDTTTPSSFIKCIPDLERSFSISIDDERILHHGTSGCLYGVGPYGHHKLPPGTLPRWARLTRKGPTPRV